MIDLAKKAYKLYANSKTKEPSLAALYLLNAITHDPRIEYLREYVCLLSKMTDTERADALPRAYDMLSVAALNGDPNDLKSVQELVAEVHDLEFSQQSVGATNSSTSDADGIVESLEALSWSNLKRRKKMFDISALQEKIEALKEALSSGQLSDAIAEKYINEMDKTQWQISLVGILMTIDGTLSYLKTALSDGKANSSRVGALMAQASGALSQLWVLKPEGPLSKDELDAICKERQAQFTECEPSAQKILSENAFSEAGRLKRKFDREVDAPGDFTVRMKNCQQTIQSLQEILGRIPFKNYRDTVAEMIQDVGARYTHLSQMRYARYQKEMATRALNAIKEFDATTFVSEDDALNILSKCRFARVDESQLSPEASSIFQSAKSMLEAKLGRVKRAEFDYECVTSAKDSQEHY